MNKKRVLILTYSKDLLVKKNNFLKKYNEHKDELDKRNVKLVVKSNNAR